MGSGCRVVEQNFNERQLLCRRVILGSFGILLGGDVPGFRARKLQVAGLRLALRFTRISGIIGSAFRVNARLRSAQSLCGARTAQRTVRTTSTGPRSFSRISGIMGIALEGGCALFRVRSR